MAKVWYCRSCGYEVHSRGRCHSCGSRLIPSSMPELAPGREEDEVGYTLDEWSEGDRGRLIEQLNDLGVQHRFEGEELVVDASDEERVDDLVAVLADISAADLRASAPGGAETATEDRAPTLEEVADELDEVVGAAVRLLASAAGRLQADPTDMQADADVAEASAAVFTVDRYASLDEDAWSAVGRVTRRLLAMLGADEAMDDGIRSEAAVLSRLLAPLEGGDEAGFEGEKTVYELPEWLPEQRAQLGALLSEAGISHLWEGADLLVPAERESEVEALFDSVAGDDDSDDDEDRYQAVEELFAASGRLAGAPEDENRLRAVVDWYERCQGPPLLGMDDVDWFRIMSRAKALVAEIEGDRDAEQISTDAQAVHDLLRRVV